MLDLLGIHEWRWIAIASLAINRRLYGTDETLCSRAWRCQDDPWWARFVAVVGAAHCEQSHAYWWPSR